MISRNSVLKSRIPEPLEIKACFTEETDLTMKSRSCSLLTGNLPFNSKTVLSEPSATYKSPYFAASLKNSTCPLWSRSKQPLTNTFFAINSPVVVYEVSETTELHGRISRKH